MKAPVLWLVVSTAAFGASTAYFWHQNSRVREQSELVAQTNQRLNARIAELEKAREELMTRRMAGPGGAGGGNPFIAGNFDQNTPAADTQVAVQVAEAVEKDAKSAPPMMFNRTQMPPSMVKTIRNQMRAQNEKNYFDLKGRLGLGDEEARKLLDLITEQQTAGFNRPRDPDDPAHAETMRNEWQRIDDQIDALLGPTKSAQYDDYQKEMPARMEVSMLAQQFESSEAPLSDQQRSRLISAMSEERASVPAPSYSSASSQEQFSKDLAAWQSDYDQRIAERARTILNSTQLTVYEEYQQFQKEMRAQMAASGRMMPGNVSMVGPAMRMGATRVVAPPPPPKEAGK